MMGVISHQLGAGDSLPNTRSFQTVTLGLAFPASAIQKFPMSKLKIDSSFVRDVSVNADDAMIATAIISMAKSLRLKVIAEGVENEAQMSFLRQHRCDEIQGYYFSRPLAVADVADTLQGTVHAFAVHNGT